MTYIATSEEDEAARWAILLDGPPLDAETQSEFDDWLAGGERRAGALLRAEATLAFADRARALGAPRRWERSRSFLSRHYRTSLAALAASVALMVAVGVGSGGSAAFEISTAVGEMRRVPLADGSVTSVNTDSKLDVKLQTATRDVTLEKGEAWFQVAHDADRPFIVKAGRINVRAVGTSFSVRRRDGGAEVLVTEGVVETWVDGHEDQKTRVAAGTSCFVSETLPAPRIAGSSDQIGRELAWRTGELALKDQSLAYAVSELNRYNDRKIVIDDPALGRETLVGYFRTNKPEDFAHAAARMIDAKVDTSGGTIRIHR